MQSIKNFNKYCGPSSSGGKKSLSDIFTLPKKSISLPDIALMFTAKDFRVLSSEFNPLHEGIDSPEVDTSFKNCLKEVMNNQNHNTIDVENAKFIGQEIGETKYGYMEPSPCLKLTKSSQCNQFCTWQKNFFDDMAKNDFLTIMKYALPQRKLR